MKEDPQAKYRSQNCSSSVLKFDDASIHESQQKKPKTIISNVFSQINVEKKLETSKRFSAAFFFFHNQCWYF